MAATRAMAVTPKATGILKSSPQASEEQIIKTALTQTATLRDAEASIPYLTWMTERLLTEPLEYVLKALQAIAEMPRRKGEAGLPTLGMVLREIRKYTHPLSVLRELVSKLARAYGAEVDEEMLEVYCDVLGHRTDMDLQAGYKSILREESIKKMPTPQQYLSWCGIPKVFRDGSRPE